MYLGVDVVYELKDSGKREEFESGARRDTQEGKPEYGLIPTPFLTELARGLARLRDSNPEEFELVRAGLALVPAAPLLGDAALYQLGARKYGANNYQKGIPYSRVVESLLRHAFAVRDGQTDERHLAAVRWNAGAILFYEDQIARGLLPESLDDIGWCEEAASQAEQPEPADVIVDNAVTRDSYLPSTPEEVQKRNQLEEAVTYARTMFDEGAWELPCYYDCMRQHGFPAPLAYDACRELDTGVWQGVGRRYYLGYRKDAPAGVEVCP